MRWQTWRRGLWLPDGAGGAAGSGVSGRMPASPWTAALGFALGCSLLQLAPQLPAPGWSLTALVGLMVPAWLLARRRVFRALPWLVAGLLCAFWQANRVLDQRLPVELEGSDLTVEGVVASLPKQDERRVRVLFEVDRASGWDRPGRLLLSWYEDPPELQPGQRWRLRVRMKRPRGFANPGGFDYAGWLFRNGVGATGYVRRSADNRRLGGLGWPGVVDRWRGRLVGVIERTVPDPAAGLLAALAVGDRSAIGADQWALLKRTGTNHLLAISGLHIGLVATLAFFIGRWLWSLPGGTLLRVPAPMAGALAAVLAAAAYALLAGWSLPTQRAFIMVAVLMMALLLRRRPGLTRALALALGAVLLLDPLATLDPGFWLSFGAVGALLFGMGWRPREGGWWWRWGRAQWVVALGLLPVLVLLFQSVSVIAPLANLVAIPWVSFLVVPPLLIGLLLSSLSPALAAPLLGLAGGSLDILWSLLAWLAEWPHASWRFAGLPWWVLCAALGGSLLLLAPRGLPGRRWGVIGLVALLLYRPPAPAPGSAWVTLLDVGHGLAAVVRTADHLLLFDSGPAYSDRFDAGNAVIVPYLQHAGVERIDRVIISHGDRDHIGGLDSVRRAMTVGEVVSGVADRIPGARRCVAGEAWRWDGVDFRILHPSAGGRLRGNDGSCVLRVATAAGSVLLPGDIEAAGEQAMLERLAGGLDSDVLVAPHHGSRTSSTAAFVQAVTPAWVLFPVGYRDRYGHPHPEVVARYRDLGAGLFDSAGSGALAVRLTADRPPTAPCRYRIGWERYWREPVASGVGRPWQACRQRVR